jgi:hypothetical protein
MPWNFIDLQLDRVGPGVADVRLAGRHDQVNADVAVVPDVAAGAHDPGVEPAVHRQVQPRHDALQQRQGQQHRLERELAPPLDEEVPQAPAEDLPPLGAVALPAGDDARAEQAVESQCSVRVHGRSSLSSQGVN